MKNINQQNIELPEKEIDSFTIKCVLKAQSFRFGMKTLHKV